MVAASKYTTTLKSGVISDWNRDTEAFIEASPKVDDAGKEHMVRQAANDSENINKELATTVAAVDLIRADLVRTLSDFRAASDPAEVRTKIFASSWDEKPEEAPVIAPVGPDQWEETGDE
jgi:hypothetical protein